MSYTESVRKGKIAVISGLVMLLFWVFIGFLVGSFGVHNGNVLSDGQTADCKGVFSGSLVGNVLSGDLFLVSLWVCSGKSVVSLWTPLL